MGDAKGVRARPGPSAANAGLSLLPGLDWLAPDGSAARLSPFDTMRSYTADEAEAAFDEVLDRAQHGPVQVTQHGRVAAVLVSAQDYADMRAFHAERLLKTLEQTTQEAAARGLTDAALQRLLQNP